MSLQPERFAFEFFEEVNETLRQTLQEKYQIEELDIEDVFTNTQLSKIEQRSHYLYVLIQLPEFDRVKRQFLVKEIHCFVSNEYFLLIDKDQFKHLNQFRQSQRYLTEVYLNPFNLLYEMIDYFVTRAFRVLGKFRKEISDIELEIFDFQTSDDDLKTILVVQRNLINFTSIIHPLQVLIRDMQTKNNRFIDPEGQEKLDDSLDKIKKMLNSLDNFKDQLQLLAATNEALITRSTNDLIKVLTSLNLLALVPTLLAGIFGMNVYFGWDSSADRWPLLLIIGLMFATTGGLLIFFRRRKWI